MKNKVETKKLRWTDKQPTPCFEQKRTPTFSKHFNPPSKQIEKLKEEGKWKHED